MIYTINEILLSQTWQIGDDGFEEHYEYNAADGTMKLMGIQGDTINFGYDALKRLSAKEVVPAGGTDILMVDYTYKTDAAANTTTTQNLVYDEVGNPTTYYNGSKTLTMSWRYGRRLSNVVNGLESGKKGRIRT